MDVTELALLPFNCNTNQTIKGGVSNFEGKEAVQYELSIQLFRVPAFVYQFQRGIFQYNLTLFVIFQKMPYTGMFFGHLKWIAVSTTQ